MQLLIPNVLQIVLFKLCFYICHPTSDNILLAFKPHLDPESQMLFDLINHLGVIIAMTKHPYSYAGQGASEGHAFD